MDYLGAWKARREKKMVEVYGCNVISMKMESQSQSESNEMAWSNVELDHLPLIQRRKLLLSSKPSPNPASGGDPKSQNQINNEKNINTNVSVVVVKKEEQFDSQDSLLSFPSASPISKGIDQKLDKIQVDSGAVDQHSQNVTSCQGLGAPMDSNCQGPKENTTICSEVNINGVGLGKVDVSICTSPQNPMLLKKPAEVKAEYSDNPPQRFLGNSMSGSPDTDMQAPKCKSNILDDFSDDLDHIVLKERLRMLLSRKMLMSEKPILEGMLTKLDSCDRLDVACASTSSMTSSALLNVAKVKDEPLDNNELHNSDRNAIGNSSFNMVPVKSELEIPNELYKDNVDHMQLRDRMKLQTTGEDSESNFSGNFKCLRKPAPSAVEYGPSISEASNPIRIIRPRKRKKTATDSVQTALEEDAPGLLQVLIEQGVSVEEIKLYGETDDDEPIDESFIEDGFADLEAVMSKLFFQRNSLLKFAPVRCTKGSKPSYCLACLFSLVEQARYLRFRNWPAEWGWCRDLQSFIFVFEKHNRIVLERPEYGYATYFFEMVDSLPIHWQIKRLVTVMKLTICGRITLIENRALSIGEDLSEGEAQVLMQFGWTPNSGLGTMLNYCDRVVHDRKNERDSSEWRSKIGKLLTDGYNGGTIVSNNIQGKVVEYSGGENSQIKMEL